MRAHIGLYVYTYVDMHTYACLYVCILQVDTLEARNQVTSWPLPNDTEPSDHIKIAALLRIPVK